MSFSFPDKSISMFNIFSTFDFLLEIGVKPVVELSFMPEWLASGSHTVCHVCVG